MFIDDLKEKLDRVGSSENFDSLISRGEAFLNDLAGIPLDFEVEGLAKTLLLEYCRYDYNNAVEYFEQNFASQILRLQLESAVSVDVENES